MTIPSEEDIRRCHHDHDPCDEVCPECGAQLWSKEDYASRARDVINARVVSPSEALKTALAVRFPEVQDEISFEYVGDLTYVVTVPAHLDPDDVRHCALDVLPVTIRVEVKHP